ncbi:MAG: choice-of-anchor D domain-containing protein [Myxococcales bacterium]|nr:choice-of-anchor D domain-containing protein [Myxococcales bacterium]
MRRLLWASVLAVTLAACGTKPPDPPGPVIPAYRGLLATPPQLTWTCVIPGCDTTLKVKVASTVNRRVAIKRIVLSEENAEYTVTPSEAAPFILGAASDFSVDVRFAPKSAPTSQRLNLLVTYTDASAEESPDRIEPGELSIPLVRRLVGEPLMEVSPPTLSFGVVPLNARKSMPVKVTNGGFGNIALAVDRADAGTDALIVNLPVNAALVPDAGVDVPISFAPTSEVYVKHAVQLGSSTPGVEPVYVQVEATSYSTPRLLVEPEERAIDFGEVPRTMSKQVSVRLANVGGQTLNLTNVSVRDLSGNLKVTLPGGMSTATLLPLQRLTVDLELDGTNPGIVDGALVIQSNDPMRGMLEVPIIGTVTEPRLQASPTSISWGVVPMGWAVAKPIELRNVGYGTLTIKRISFVGGTSTLYSFKNLPALPATLPREGRLAFEVEFRAETAASFMGSLSIETDDAVEPFQEVTLSATGGTCAAGCPISHGTPSCSTGTCSIGACDTGWYDTDVSPATGCECQEIGSDPGEFCSSALNKGTLSDSSSSSTSHTGIIHSENDIDFIRFYGQDNSQFLSDDYDVRINMSSGDPNIMMCVYRYDTGNNVNECYLNNETCNIRSYRNDGDLGAEDGAVYYIKIFRRPNTAPTCTSYTVYMQNG